MTYKFHHREPFRLRGFDYSRPGVFFVTLCAWQRGELFGTIAAGEMQCSSLGKIVRAEWFRTVQACEGVQAFRSEFVVMPNHLHGIVWIMRNGAPGSEATWMDPPEMADPVRSDQRAPTYLGSFIAMYKLAVMSRAREELALRYVWQPNYGEHIIRSEGELQERRVSILTNPVKWEEDPLRPGL